MKEKTDSSSDAHDTPLCPLRDLCVLWLEEIEAARAGDGVAKVLDIPGQNREARHQVRELCLHVQQCLVCSRALDAARAQRDYQRRALRLMLLQDEQVVPSTTSNILAAIRNNVPPTVADPHTPIPVIMQETPPLVPQTHVGRYQQVEARRKLRSQPILAWITAAVIVMASIATLSQLVQLRPSPSSSSVSVSPDFGASSSTAVESRSTVYVQAESLVRTDTWSSVILTRLSADGKQRLVEQVDPENGHRVQILSTCCPASTAIDGVTHSGYDLLYHETNDNQTVYHLLSGKSFEIAGKTGNAIWSTDDTHIFVNSGNSVIDIRVDDGTQKVIPVRIPVSILRVEFFYQNALYFSHQEQKQKNLYRLDLGTGEITTVAVDASLDYPFWLDLRYQPDATGTGAAIFYVRYEANGNPAIYRDAQDGRGGQLWRRNAIPIGYGAGLLPIVMQKQDGEFRILQMIDQGMQDKQVRNDVAPKASAICDEPAQSASEAICSNDIAMHPEDGSHLVFGALYTGEVYRLLSLDLNQTDQPAKPLLELRNQPNAQVQLIGWDKLQTPSS